MDETLLEFVRALRSAELPVSTAETLDALQAARAVGIDNRHTLQAALGACLAKSQDDRSRFDLCFERFFATHRLDAPQAAAPPPEPAAIEQALADGEPGTDSPPQLSPLSELLLSGDDDALALAIARAGRESRLAEMRYFTQKGLFGRRLLMAMGLGELDADIHRLEQTDASQQPGKAEARQLRWRRERLRERAAEAVERHYLLYAEQQQLELRDAVLRDMRLSQVDQRDLLRMQRLVARIARRLATRFSRRRRVTRRGELDVARTLRAGLATDGVLFRTHWRRRRRDRPQVLVLCDVSGSVRSHARFLLLFLYSLADVLPRVRSFVFSSELHEVSTLFEHSDAGRAVATALDRYGRGATDYGRALRGLLLQAGRDLDRRATVIVLGDGRNNHGDPALDALAELARRSRRLLWLNPESRSAWGEGDSEMLRYAPYCRELRVCRSLRDLERFVGDLLRHPG